ncbi:hypothetical protein B0H11DRAFT_576663 [Mycena galericulata]|nr:hypothetical protein B0H11DRAFT_576663 [Mycena galericulata]
MCWPRSFCCRCPGPSSFPWPPSLTFGRTPRRPVHPPTNFPWSPLPWPFLPLNNTPPPDPVIPRSPWDRRRRVHFQDDEPPHLIDVPPAPCAPMEPFLPPPSPAPWAQQHAHAHLSPELCGPRGTYPHLDWDITTFPSAGKRLTSPHAHGAAPAFDSPATFPPARLLTLSYADSPVLLHWERHWGPILVRAQGHPAHAVTVEDVLDAVHAYFNTPLGPADAALISPLAWGLISDAYYRRLPQSPNMWAYDAKRGPLRVDVLNGATKFDGLEPLGRDYFRLMLTT